MTLAPPPFTAAEQRDRAVFLALMNALSRPGTLQPLVASGAASPLAAIGAALLDLETSFYTPDAELAEALARTGAIARPTQAADYLFFPVLDTDTLAAVRTARTGTALRPDESATLIIGCAFASGGVFRWAGPGIQTAHEVRLGGIPSGFWPLRAALRYPLGWDVFFVDGAQVLGLPRTTQVERVR